MYGVLESVAVRQPPLALGKADPGSWHYAGPVDLQLALDQHKQFLALLEQCGARVEFIEQVSGQYPDSMFTHDPSMLTRQGAVLMNMGKPLRRPETELHRAYYERLRIPLLGQIEEPATMEGGDAFWIDNKTLAVGRGPRTNDEGIRQIRAIMDGIGVIVLDFDLPEYGEKGACLHLLSLVSLLDKDLALVHASLLPQRLREVLQERGFKLIPAPEDEYEATHTISANVLAVAPRRCIMIDSAPKTKEAMESAGCTVLTFSGDEICIKLEGGPTCLTRPLARRPPNE